MISKALLDTMYSRLYFPKGATHGLLQHDLAILPSRCRVCFSTSLNLGDPVTALTQYSRNNVSPFPSLTLSWPGSFNFLSLKNELSLSVTTLTLTWPRKMRCHVKKGQKNQAAPEHQTCEWTSPYESESSSLSHPIVKTWIRDEPSSQDLSRLLTHQSWAK